MTQTLQRPLIALDGSEASAMTLSYLRPWLARCESFVLLHVVEAAPSPSLLLGDEHESMFLRGDGRDRAAIDAYLRHAAEETGLAGRATCVVEAGRVAETILTSAERHEATLIAMATHGRHGLARWTLGSQTARVSRESPVPVVVVPSHHRTTVPLPTAVRHVLVPIDGSERALALVPHVKCLTEMGKVRVTLMHCVRHRAAAADTDRAETYLFRARYVFEDAGLLPRTRIVRAPPALGIIEYALPAVDDDIPIDLIAMTTHGRSGVKRWALGSVAERVIAHAALPLMVVRSSRPD